MGFPTFAHTKEVVALQGVQRGAFTFQQGDTPSDQDIPGLDGLADPTLEEGEAQNTTGVGTSNIIQSTDVDSINQQIQDIVPGFEVDDTSFEMITTFDLSQSPGKHAFAEGIIVTVGERKHFAIVRGGTVTEYNGQTLSGAETLTVPHGINEEIDIQFVHLTQNNGDLGLSSVGFRTDGSVAVEDLRNGDRDFNDGEFASEPSGSGSGSISNTETNISETVSYRSSVSQNPLDPKVRTEQEYVRVEDNVLSETSVTTTQNVVVDRGVKVNVVFEEYEVTETERDDFEQQLQKFETRETPFSEEISTQQEVEKRGEIETENNSTFLPHATSATIDGKYTPYQRFTGNQRFALGTEGASLTLQAKPLELKGLPPTLLHGTVGVDPTAGDNEAGFTFSFGLTQYLWKTHKPATDTAGNHLVDDKGNTLLLPTGIITNEKVEGYVPETIVPAEVVEQEDGIFVINGKGIVIAKPDPNKVGKGDAAYNNAGGIIVTWKDGTESFFPQWNKNGYLENELIFEEGQVQRVTLALVPQQSGLEIELNESYSLNERKIDSKFFLITADKDPNNFSSTEIINVYGVEDTVSYRRNHETEVFNGIQGVYAGIPTVDTDDAYVGVDINTPEEILPGQEGVKKTNSAINLFAGVSVYGGVGNQKDETTTVTSTYEREGVLVEDVEVLQDVSGFSITNSTFRITDTVTTKTPFIVSAPLNTENFYEVTDFGYRDDLLTNTYEQDQTEVITTTEEILTTVSESSETNGSIEFDINDQGNLENVNVHLDEPHVTHDTNHEITSSTEESMIVSGEESLVSTSVVEGERVSEGTVSEEIDSKSSLGESTIVEGESTETVTSESTLVGREEEFTITGVQTQENILASSEQDVSTRLIDRTVSTKSESYPNVSPLQGELQVGGIYSFGRTPYSDAANNAVLMGYKSFDIIGTTEQDNSAGVRGILNFTLGEKKALLYSVDSAGSLSPVYETIPVMENGEKVLTETGIQVNDFKRDSQGNLIQARGGTGERLDGVKGVGFTLTLDKDFQEEFEVKAEANWNVDIF